MIKINNLNEMIRCDDMNSIHEKYYDWGEDIYTGVVDSLKASPGYEKIRFNWEVNADPRITKTVIFWNGGSDSVVVDINRTQSGRLALTQDINSIDEGNYIFEFITRDNEGHFSMPTEIVVEVYGDLFIQGLKTGDIVSVVTTYLPNEEALETLDALPVEYEMPVFEREINKENFEVFVLA